MAIVTILFLSWAAAVSVILLFKNLTEKPVLATAVDVQQICRRLATVIDKLDTGKSRRISILAVDDCRAKLNELYDDLNRAIAKRRASSAE